MANVTTAMVKELRQRTGAGMLDCKKTLVEAEGDIEKSIELLREKGLAKAAKKAGRIAAEGMANAFISEDGKTGVVVEINCETDFVANTDKFKSFCNDVAQHIATANPKFARAEEAPEGTPANDILLNQKYFKDASKTVADTLGDATATIGEKIDIRRFTEFKCEDGALESYIHMGGKIGVIAQFVCDKSVAENDSFKTFAHDITMHIAASNPKYVSREEVPTEAVEHEREILRAQAANENKPANIIERMVEGRIGKFYSESCLLEQPFVKDPDKKVVTLMQEISKVAGGDIAIKSFVRYECGEGIEKRKNDLAAEIAEQTKGIK